MDMFYALIGGSNPEKIKKLVALSDCDVNQFLIEIEKKSDGTFKTCNFGLPLICLIDELKHLRIKHYESMCLLLEAGADPFKGDFSIAPKELQTVPFIEALFYENLLALRLMVLAHPPTKDQINQAIEHGTWVSRENIIVSETVKEESGKKLTFRACLIKTVQAAQKIQEYKNAAETFLTEKFAIKAAETYEEVVRIYEEQINLENALVYPRGSYHSYGDATQEDCRPVVIAYYQKKQKEYLAQLYGLYQHIDEALMNKGGALTLEQQVYHVEVLDRLINLQEKFHIDITSHLKRLSSMLIKLSGRIDIHRPPKVPEEAKTWVIPTVTAREEDAETLRGEDEAASLLDDGRARGGSGASAWWEHVVRWAGGDSSDDESKKGR
jgi:hypothetical protein